jgi:hypothetical protein
MVVGIDDRVLFPSSDFNNLPENHPILAVTTVDVKYTNSAPNNHGTGIVIAPNHVLTAAHVVSSNLLGFSQTTPKVRVTISKEEDSLVSRTINAPPIDGTPPADPIDNVENIYFLADYKNTQSAEDDIALLQTNNELLDASNVMGLIAFMNPKDAIGFTIRTAGYPADNSSIPGSSGDPGRELVTSPGLNQSPGKIIRATSGKYVSFSETVDATLGQSGSGVWHTDSMNKSRVLGVFTNAVLNANNPGVNLFQYRDGGTLITEDIYQKIIHQMVLDSGTANADLLPENAIIGSNRRFFSNGDDEIFGTYRRERIIGNDGNDTIRGAGANDRIDGGEGNDTAQFSDIFENYNASFDDSTGELTLTHNSMGIASDGTDIIKNTEFGRFNNGTIPLPLLDGSSNKKSSKVLSTANQTIGSLSITAPTYTSDGDGEYTVNIAAVEPDLEYNIAYMIDVSLSMTAAELQATKDAYIELTNFFVSQGVAESSTFAIIPYNGSASLYLSSNPSQVIDYINSLTTTTGTTSYAPAFAKAKV